ncbi:hypothetical protein Tsp_15614, partial [Trichinella spiralis]|uniref:hypothetical protein n=1 Tax=Trichinella spiralis TaxID=6334 RepID=UPI0001EFEDE4
RGIPRGGAEGGAVGRGGQFRNAILVSVKHANSVTLQHIPNGNGVIADAGYQQTTAGRKVDIIHREDDALFAVFADLTVGSQIEQTATRVVGTRWQTRHRTGWERTAL